MQQQYMYLDCQKSLLAHIRSANIKTNLLASILKLQIIQMEDICRIKLAEIEEYSK